MSSKNNHSGKIAGQSATAPYNFIRLENRVIKYANHYTDAMSQATFDQDKLTGTIHYTVNTVTPLYIGNGKKEEEAAFFTNPKGVPTIPGNTIRGLTRFNASVFSYSTPVNEEMKKKDIADARFYYREFASTDIRAKKHYQNTTGLRQQVNGNYRYTVLENVHAGYMRQVKEGYSITPAIEIERTSTGKKSSYMPIHESDLRSREIKGVSYMYKAGTRREDYKNGLRNKENKEYEPYCCEAPYSILAGKTVVDAQGVYNGMLTNSAWINNKKHHYLVYEENMEVDAIKVSKEQAEIYKQDLLHTKKITEGTMEVKREYIYYELPEAGKRKPVFYIQSEVGLIFGFTPYLRLPAVGSIYDGLPEEHQSFENIDWTDALFGWAGYRSKVSFLDAQLEGIPKHTKDYQVVLTEPKASWYKAYLQQASGDALNSYNTTNFKLRGRKFYWAKKELDEKAIEKSTEAGKKSLESTLRPIQSGSTFKGAVRFENLSKKELGLLLFSLQQGDTEGKCSIGQGKPYGFGQCKLIITDLALEDLSKKYQSFSGNTMIHLSQADYTEKYINAFKAYIQEVTGVKDVSELLAYQDHTTSRSTISCENTRYLGLKDFRNIGRLKSLDEVVIDDGQEDPKDVRKQEKEERERREKEEEKKVLDSLEGFEKERYLYQSSKSNDKEAQLNIIYRHLDGYEEADQHQAAIFLKEAFKQLGKWEGKLSKKQVAKKERIETILKKVKGTI